MESFEKILNNFDVLESIFLYLDFNEQFKLIKICPQFEYVILHGAWRSMYKNLHVLEKFPDTYLLQFNAVSDIMKYWSLTYKEFHIIMHHSSMFIRKLELNDILYVKSLMSLKYHNLTELTLRDTNVEDTHLHQLAENCINLQSLSLINFTDSNHESNIRANSFGEMKALNKLEIDDTYFRDWCYCDAQQLFCLANLKIIRINIFIIDNNGNNKNSTDRVYNIENLWIGELRLEPENTRFVEDLIRFKNLTKLTIRLDVKPIDNRVSLKVMDVSDEVYDHNYISSTLETLNIENVSKLRHLEDYYGHSQSLQLCFSLSFPYLQELIMDSYYISSEDILYLKHLKVLKFDLFYYMYWSDLEILFKHPTLTHITITASHCRGFEKHHERLPNGCEGFTTILEYLSLPSEVYESGLNFWPNFRQRNKLLKLNIVYSDWWLAVCDELPH